MEESFIRKDIISINELTKEEIDFILDLAGDIEKNPAKYDNIMKGKIMAPLFFEPSTRTFSSFQSAMLHMGGSILDFDVEASSIKKGETLTDTAKMIEGYKPSVVVMRHKKDGSARLVADIMTSPVINAGDGQNQHPTQTLLDLYTIRAVRGGIDSVKIIMAGDLKYGRTVHSLALALSKYKECEVFFVSPESLRMPHFLLDELSRLGLKYREFSLDDLKRVLPDAEILYMTRIQRERFPEGLEGEEEYLRISNKYHLTKQILGSVNLKSGFKIMHPLPKVDEIERDVDDMTYAHYFKQAENGLYVRKALIALVTGALKNG
ncbi:MAG: aspartate carbamoyltransferase [archaeon]